MTSFKVSIVIDQVLDTVDAALMNPDNFVYWTAYLEKFEVIKGGPGEVGSIAHLHYLQKGRSYVMEDKLIYCEPGKKYISKVSGDALSATVETTLYSLGEKTEMNLKWDGEGRTLILKLLLPVFKNRVMKGAKKDLAAFKRLVETNGSDFRKVP